MTQHEATLALFKENEKKIFYMWKVLRSRSSRVIPAVIKQNAPAGCVLLDSDDLKQDLAIWLWEACIDYIAKGSPGKFMNFYYTKVFGNLSIRARETCKVKYERAFGKAVSIQEPLDDDDGTTLEEYLHGYTNVENEVIEKSLYDNMQKLLTAKQYRVMRLYYKNYTPSEIDKMLGETTEYSAYVIKRAKKRLKAIYSGQMAKKWSAATTIFVGVGQLWEEPTRHRVVRVLETMPDKIKIISCTGTRAPVATWVKRDKFKAGIGNSSGCFYRWDKKE